LGALDGKHVVITLPVNSGSHFYNYKNTFSVVLLALVDADYKFIYVDVGTNGRVSDGGVFAKSELARALQDNTWNFPNDQPLPGRNIRVPFAVVADEAFPLKPNVMKPYSGKMTTSIEKRIYNYRVSRARRIVENAFGILANRFRIFLTRIPLAPEKVQLIVLASCALHNLLRVRASTDLQGLADTENEISGTITPGSWRQLSSNESWQRLMCDNNRRSTDYANEVRDEFCQYFNNEGAVPWQNNMINDY
jgi:hypothetical protein